MAGSFWISER
jgi:hypothetical protein